MKLSTKIYSSIITLMLSPTLYAAQDLQLDIIKQMYQMGKKLEKGNEVIEMYADESLQHAFDLHESDGEACGFDHDIMWQSNDPEYNRALIFTNLGNNKVKVNLGKANFQEPSSVIYKLNCKGNVCKINDVIDESGSLKQHIYKECRS